MGDMLEARRQDKRAVVFFKELKDEAHRPSERARANY